jgi:ABC-type Fe3+ transport system substrate-binding protein
MTNSRTRRGAIAAALTVLLATAACGNGSDGASSGSTEGVPAEFQSLYQAAVKEGGTFVVYSNLVSDTLSKVTAAFNKQFPGMKMQGQFYAGAPMEAKVSAEVDGGNLVADVVQIGNATFLSSLVDKGALHDMTDVPGIDQIPESYRNGTHYFAHEVFVSAITYNTNAVKTEPTSYEQVVDMGKKAGIVDPRAGGGSAYIMYFLTKTYGDSIWTKVKSNGVVLNASVANAVPAVVSGDLDAIINSQGAGACAQSQGKPVKVAYPAEGVTPLVFYTGVFAKAKHPAAAKLYAAWAASREGQQLITDTDCTFSARPDVTPFKGLPKLTDLKVTAYPLAQYNAEYPTIAKQAATAAGLSS